MEGMPERRSSSLDTASMEGTIRMPQVGFGIRLYSAQHWMEAPDPKEAIAELVAPIPLDEKLTRKTQKANAQHQYHGIARPLSDEQVRTVQASGNLQTLVLIGKALGQP